MRVVLAGLLALVLAAPAWAGRTPSVRAEGPRVPSQGDIRVPYLTSGTNAFHAYSVAPKILQNPVSNDPFNQQGLGVGPPSASVFKNAVVDDPFNPGARPVFLLPFYGARVGFSGGTNGTVPKPYLLPSQAK